MCPCSVAKASHVTDSKTNELKKSYEECRLPLRQKPAASIKDVKTLFSEFYWGVDGLALAGRWLSLEQATLLSRGSVFSSLFSGDGGRNVSQDD